MYRTSKKKILSAPHGIAGKEFYVKIKVWLSLGICCIPKEYWNSERDCQTSFPLVLSFSEWVSIACLAAKPLYLRQSVHERWDHSLAFISVYHSHLKHNSLALSRLSHNMCWCSLVSCYSNLCISSSSQLTPNKFKCLFSSYLTFVAGECSSDSLLEIRALFLKS